MISPTRRARELRRACTRAETLLWAQLRDRRIGGCKVRRQRPIGRFFADFACLSARLIIEIDGPSHELTGHGDALRTRRLEAQGYRVIRFTNEQVLRDLDSVVRTIEAIVLERLIGRRGRSPSP
jgi:very-short-patch-repair endonuclease